MRECYVEYTPSNSDICLMKKLRHFKLRLRDWNRDIFGNIFQEIDQAVTDLGDIQHIIATEGDSNGRFDT